LIAYHSMSIGVELVECTLIIFTGYGDQVLPAPRTIKAAQPRTRFKQRLAFLRANGHQHNTHSTVGIRMSQHQFSEDNDLRPCDGFSGVGSVSVWVRLCDDGNCRRT